MYQYNKNFWLDQSVSALPPILDFLLPLYEKSFGTDHIYGEQCIIYNDASSDCPELEVVFRLIRIRLSTSSMQYWCQVIFQLSHELCHYALRQYRHPCDHHLPALSWLEEIISTAFSWYALKYSSDNWSKCKLSLFAADYAHGLSGYLVQLQKCPANHLFAACNTVDALVQYDVHRMAQENRASQQVEIATVFQAFVDNPASLQMLGNYYLYRRMDGVTIDFERWHHDSDNPLISVLESVQPVKSSTPVD